ncbi:hypothetical protein C8F01DRAFT_1233220 [Mycena amicta]|nr:hypothetical protein C8F01DRAFT_1233220 [Mycena amicta]
MTMHSTRSADGFHVTVPLSDAPSRLLLYEYVGPSLIYHMKTEALSGCRHSTNYCLLWFHETETAAARSRNVRLRSMYRSAFVTHVVASRSGTKVSISQVQTRLTILKRTPVYAIRRLIEFSFDGNYNDFPDWMTKFDRSPLPNTPVPRWHGGSTISNSTSGPGLQRTYEYSNRRRATANVLGMWIACTPYIDSSALSDIWQGGMRADKQTVQIENAMFAIYSCLHIKNPQCRRNFRLRTPTSRISFYSCPPLKMDSLRLDVPATGAVPGDLVPLLSQVADSITHSTTMITGQCFSVLEEEGYLVIALRPPVRGPPGVKKLFEIAASNLAKIADTQSAGATTRSRGNWVNKSSNSDNTLIYVRCGDKTLKMSQRQNNMNWLPVEGGYQADFERRGNNEMHCYVECGVGAIDRPSTALSMVDSSPSLSHITATVGGADSIIDHSGVMYGSSANNGWIIGTAASSTNVYLTDTDPSRMQRHNRPYINVLGGRPTIFFFILGWNGVRLNMLPVDVFVDRALQVHVPLVNVNFVPAVECVAIVTGDCISTRVIGSKTRVTLGSPALASGRMRRSFETFAVTLEKIARNNEAVHLPRIAVWSRPKTHSRPALIYVELDNDTIMESVRYDGLPWVPITENITDIVCQGALLRCSVSLVACVAYAFLPGRSGEIGQRPIKFKLKASSIKRCYRRDSTQTSMSQSRPFFDLSVPGTANRR